ncbi:uncharacterized protein TNCV_305721 [Trichonephila clavipes]|nr:uncharacterized protein TNCV_305721 [Trichonephila clavipes]
MFEKVSALLDCPTALLEEFAAINDEDSPNDGPQRRFVQSFKNVLGADSDNEKEMNKDGRKTTREANDVLDPALYLWFSQRRSKGDPISGPLLCEKALGLNEKFEGLADFRGQHEGVQWNSEKYGNIFHNTALGLGSNPGEDMDVCKRKVPSRHGGTLDSRRAASPLVRWVEGEERWETPDPPWCVLPQNWGETEQNHSVTCIVLKAMANDSVTLLFAMMNLIRPLPISMANRLVFMLRREALRLDEWQQASMRSFEAWILTSRKIFAVRIREEERVFLLAVGK